MLTEENLLFFRDQLARNFDYNYSIVWSLPNIILEDNQMEKLVQRWFYSTKKDLRLYLEGRIFQRVRERYGSKSL